jgi:hypothetical protein
MRELRASNAIEGGIPGLHPLRITPDIGVVEASDSLADGIYLIFTDLPGQCGDIDHRLTSIGLGTDPSLQALGPMAPEITLMGQARIFTHRLSQGRNHLGMGTLSFVHRSKSLVELTAEAAHCLLDFSKLASKQFTLYLSDALFHA